MTSRRFRFPVKAFATLLSAACFLAFNIAAVAPALAADPAPKPSSTWETWPKKPEPLPSGQPASPTAAGEEAGGKTYAGISSGTWGWIAGGVAAAALIAVAAGGGGGGGGGGSSSTPTH
jgi:hypothetical protein